LHLHHEHLVKSLIEGGSPHDIIYRIGMIYILWVEFEGFGALGAATLHVPRDGVIGQSYNQVAVLGAHTSREGADPLRLHPCEVANSVAVFRELSWLTRRMAKVKLDRKAAGLRLAHLPGLRTATDLH